MRRSRLVVLGMVLALATAACGSRTTAAQKLEALGGGRNGGGTESLTGGDVGTGSSDSSQAAGANGANGANGGTGGATGGKSAGPNAAAGKNTAPAGGNGAQGVEVAVTPDGASALKVSGRECCPVFRRRTALLPTSVSIPLTPAARVTRRPTFSFGREPSTPARS